MASVDECRQALRELATRLEGNAEQVRERVNLDRTLACRITDLGAAFHGRLTDGRLVDLADGDDPKAKIAMNIGSDDLLALVRGDLDVGRALAARRLSVSASPFDLLKLRKLL